MNAEGERVQIAIAVVEHDGRYLIGLRPEDVPLAGYWEFPGGKVRAGEAAADAAMRECREETGLDVRVVSEYPSALHDYQHAALSLRFFACQLCAAPPADVAARFRWVTAGELSSYQFPPANAALLALLATGC